MEAHPVERERLRAAALRALESLVEREATAEQLTAWAAMLEEFAAKLEGSPPESVLWAIGSRSIFSAAAVHTPAGYARQSSGPGDRVTATVTFGPEHEGHRGLAYGGAIAQVFDGFFGTFDVTAQGDQFTSELNVRFLKKVPIGRELTLEAKVDAVDGNRRRFSGQASAAGTVYVEADAVFVTKEPQPA